MKRLAVWAAIGLGAFVGTSHGQAVQGNWTNTWSDEFNVGNSDLTGWTRQTGAGGWGNQELETYTSSSANAFVSTDQSTGIGALTVRAIATGSGANQTYTSARLNTSANLFSQTNGLFEFRAKLPAGQGLWPAVWMMPQNSTYGSWPTSGEIDMLESTGQNTKLVQGSLHSGADANSNYTQTQTYQGSGKEPAGFSTVDWHTYDVEWDAGTASSQATFKFFVDGTLYNTIHGGWYVPAGGSSSAPFDKPFYLLINLAVGGSYVGSPSLSPGNYDMQIDYFRAYSGTAPEPASVGLLGVVGMILGRRRPRRV